jgi:hypothetical protein
MRTQFEVTRAFYVELLASLGLVAACNGGGDSTVGSASATAPTSSATEAPTSGTEGATSTSTSETEASETTEAELACDPPPPEMVQKYVCFPVPEGLADCAACDAACTAEEALSALVPDPLCKYEQFVVQCGPDPSPATPGQCCYVVAHTEGWVCAGRPFIIEGDGRVAPSVRRSDWQGSMQPSLAGLSDASRAALAELWGAAAADEHASIAAFARFALQLLAVGAPASLVEGAQRAMVDETAHARACYALAAAYAGCPMGPGRLDVTDALAEADLASMAAMTVREGCVGETLAALIAQVAASHARDHAVRSALKQIAADEARHAQLAWRFVQWALGRSPAAREAVREAFAAALREPVAVRPWPAEADPVALRAHGCLAPEEQLALCRDALTGVIGPAAETLLGGVTQAAA